MRNKYWVMAALLFLTVLSGMRAQCTGKFVFQFDGPPNQISFKDTSVYPAGWQRIYTRWNFGDGTKDSGQIVSHTFPLFKSYDVIRSVRFEQAGNPAAFCAHADTVHVDSLPPSLQGISYKFNVKRLNANTFGLMSYYYGSPWISCDYNIDSGYVASTVPPHYFSAPVKGTLIYTLPQLDPQSWAFQYLIVLHPISNSGGYDVFDIVNWGDSLVDLQPGPCNASFLLARDSTSLSSWVVYDYSSGTNLSYLWNFGDSTTSSLQHPSHTYAYPGNHTVCLTVSGNGCSNTQCDTAYVSRKQLSNGMTRLRVVQGPLTGTREIPISELRASLYPNPADNELDIDLQKSYADLRLTLSDISGRLVYEQALPPFFQAGKINIAFLQPGIYLLAFHDGSGRLLGVKKLIKK